MRYKAPTIAEKGGLEVHMTGLGVDYKLFKLLRTLNGQTNSSIAKSLSDGRKRPFKPSTVAHWCRVDDEETSNASR